MSVLNNEYCENWFQIRIIFFKKNTQKTKTKNKTHTIQIIQKWLCFYLENTSNAQRSHNVDVIQQRLFVCFPKVGQVWCVRPFVVRQLNGDFHITQPKVVPILHAAVQNVPMNAVGDTIMKKKKQFLHCCSKTLMISKLKLLTLQRIHGYFSCLRFLERRQTQYDETQHHLCTQYKKNELIF